VVYPHLFLLILILDIIEIICIIFVFILDGKVMKNLKSGLFMFIIWLWLSVNFSFAGNPFVRNLLWTQLEIWLSQRSSFGELRNWKTVNSLVLQQEVASQNNFDLISQLDKAKSESERLWIINQYIISLKNTISNGKKLWEYEQTQVDYYNNEAKKCETPIKAKNSEFSNAVKNYDYEKAESIAKEIAELRACIARNQVYAKAHASYASSSESVNNLQKRVDYLSQNKEKIAKYYEILKPDLLKELYDISKTVKNF